MNQTTDLNHTYPLPESSAGSLRWLAGILAAHAALLAWAVHVSHPLVEKHLSTMSVQILHVSPPKETPKKLEPPKPQPVRKPVEKPQVKRVVTTAPAPAPIPEKKPDPQPVVPPAPPTPPTPPAPPQVTPPRFDAAYLNNPAPAYPALSRRLGEEGKVLLRVQVGPDGRALQVLIHRTSGYSRLDDAAQDAVSTWRFVPAKSGDAATTAWVIVPINFDLTR